jgi:hypothetical protein
MAKLSVELIRNPWQAAVDLQYCVKLSCHRVLHSLYDKLPPWYLINLRLSQPLASSAAVTAGSSLLLLQFLFIELMQKKKKFNVVLRVISKFWDRKKHWRQ